MAGGMTGRTDREQNRMSMLLSVMIVLILLAVIAVSGLSLYGKLRANEARKAQLQEEIAREQERTQQIEEYREYTKTNEFIQEIARQKLGLVYEGEVVFREENVQKMK